MRLDQTDLETLGRIFGLAVGDPERKRFEARPDNAALLLAYRRFLDAPDIEGARPDDAEAEMREFVAGHTTSEPAAARPEAPSFLEWLSQLMHPRVLAPAAFVVVLAVGALMWPTQSPETSVLRDATDTRSMVLEAPQRLPEGSFRLAWKPLVGADAYDVRLLAADLEEIARVESIDQVELIVSSSSVAAFEQIRFWQVIGLTSGDELLRSSIETLK